MKVSRRVFLKFLGIGVPAAAVAASTGLKPAQARTVPKPEMRRVTLEGFRFVDTKSTAGRGAGSTSNFGKMPASASAEYMARLQEAMNRHTRLQLNLLMNHGQ